MAGAHGDKGMQEQTNPTVAKADAAIYTLDTLAAGAHEGKDLQEQTNPTVAKADAAIYTLETLAA
eukprot:12517914-Ditylum_brightwellii.AAC.1